MSNDISRTIEGSLSPSPESATGSNPEKKPSTGDPKFDAENADWIDARAKVVRILELTHLDFPRASY